MELSKYEISAPHYRIAQGGIVLEPMKNLFVQAGIQHLSYDLDDLWGRTYSSRHCFYAGMGLKTLLGPVKLNFAMGREKRLSAMFSLGYDYDIFHYSRK